MAQLFFTSEMVINLLINVIKIKHYVYILWCIYLLFPDIIWQIYYLYTIICKFVSFKMASFSLKKIRSCYCQGMLQNLRLKKKIKSSRRIKMRRNWSILFKLRRYITVQDTDCMFGISDWAMPTFNDHKIPVLFYLFIL